MLAVVALFSTVSALDPSLTFHYEKYPRVFRRNLEACQLCYGEFDCISMDECSYNAATTELLDEDDTRSIVKGATPQVDSMMYDLLLEDSLSEYTECIPLISSYTNCNKDNICLGCKTCDCDQSGHWNCSVTYKCSKSIPDDDRQVFTSVVDQLKSESRYKRSYEAYEEPTTHYVFEDLAEWIYVSKPMEVATVRNAVSSTNVPSTKSVTLKDENNNNLAFDEILSYDNLDQWIKEEKDNENMNINADTSKFLQILKNIEEGLDDRVHINNPLNVQLLKDLKKYLNDNSYGNETTITSNDQPNSINAIVTDTDDFDFEKQESYLNPAASVVKRKVRDVRNESTTENIIVWRNWTQIFENETKNITHPEKELHHILDVVNVLINTERKEIKHLNYVKVNLLKFLNNYKNKPTHIDMLHQQHNYSGDNYRNHENWKIEMLNFYINNLKRDVKDTMRDIYAIQKLKKLGVAAEESTSNLKPLLYALTSYYLNKTSNFRHLKKSNVSYQISNNASLTSQFSSNSSSRNQLPTKNSLTNQLTNNALLTNLSAPKTFSSEPKPQRRVFEQSNINYYKIRLIKRAIMRMLTMIDTVIPSPTPAKGGIKKIFDRIIIKEYVNVQLPIRGQNFNLTEILTDVNEKWVNMPTNIQNLNPSDQLYSLKLIYLTLSQGIDKMKDALLSMQVGYSRRMNFIDLHLGKDLVADAHKYLADINARVKKFNFNAVIKSAPPRRNDDEKKSIWQNIKTAFSKSKNGLVKYFQHNFQKPKKYIVNDMVRKRLEEVNRQKFLEIMKRWQENFDHYKDRSKRSVKHFPKRMKNIIPKYLRGKVNPAIHGNNKSSKGNDIDNDKNIKVILEKNHHAKINPTIHPKQKYYTLKTEVKLITHHVLPLPLPSTKRGVRTQTHH